MKEEKNRLKELRTCAGVNQKELAEYVGITQQQISNIENGSVYPSLTVAKKLAVYFNESIDDIFFTEKSNLEL